MIKCNFTKDQAIAEHRKMWRWIYDETVKQKRPVGKEEYLVKNNIFGLYSNCFLCDYAVLEKIMNGQVFHMCDCCPLDWDSKAKNGCKCLKKEDFTTLSPEKTITGYYYRWRESFRKGDYKEAAKYAYKIANLKEKKNEMRNSG